MLNAFSVEIWSTYEVEISPEPDPTGYQLSGSNDRPCLAVSTVFSGENHPTRQQCSLSAAEITNKTINQEELLTHSILTAKQFLFILKNFQNSFLRFKN